MKTIEVFWEKTEVFLGKNQSFFWQNVKLFYIKKVILSKKTVSRKLSFNLKRKTLKSNL